MYRIGKEEVKRIEALFESGQVFRYGMAGECDRFEAAWAERLGVAHCRLTSNGTSALYAALVGWKVGPGDSVIVPACTYMATALSVLAVGAIPIVADVDESITLCPKDTERRIKSHTKAIIPVHMWGLCCDMDPIMELAKRKGLLVVEDACQAVGGAYKGRMLGSIGDAGAFSFNYYKNITSGEGGAFVASLEDVFIRGSVAVDCCSYYWNPEEHREDVQFAGLNFRATEVSGAMLNAQLERIDDMLDTMREHKRRILEAGERAGLTSIQNNSLGHDCGTQAGFLFENEEQARAFKDSYNETAGGAFLPIDTGRHVYTRWDPIMRKQGAHHPALNPYLLPDNREVDVEYTMDMCSRSLDILSRSVLLPMHPDNGEDRLQAMEKAVVFTQPPT